MRQLFCVWFFACSAVTRCIGGFLTSLPLGQYGILIVMMLMVFFLGFFLDWMEISFIILPILATTVGSLDFNINGFGVIEKPALVWFTVLVAMCLQTSFLTPPVGFAIFYLKGASPAEIELIDIYKGVIPFYRYTTTGATDCYSLATVGYMAAINRIRCKIERSRLLFCYRRRHIIQYEWLPEY